MVKKALKNAQQKAATEKKYEADQRDPDEIRENKKGFLEMEGVIEEVLPNARFRVKLHNGQMLMAHLSGKMRVHNIRVIMGDNVLVEMSPYDLLKGRIIRRR